MLQSQHLKASICDVVFPLAVSASAIPSLVLACVVTIAWRFAAAVSKRLESYPCHSLVPRHVGELGTGTVMMHARWVVSFLGGHKDHNWASHVTASLTNKLLGYLQRLATRDGLTEAEIKESISRKASVPKQ